MKGPYEKHVRLTHYMINHPAWLSLSPVARCIWLQLKDRFDGYNNGKISLSCREAGADLDASKDTANKGFRQLQDCGFIKVGTPSGFNMKLHRATRWILTDEVLNGRAPTAEWRRWKPDGNSEHGLASGTNGPISGTLIPNSATKKRTQVR